MSPSGEPPLPYPDSYWVIPGRLLAGEYPGSAATEAETRRKVRLLLQSGVGFIVDLTEEGEAGSYQPALNAERIDLGKACAWQRFPIRNFTAPTPEQLVAILDAVDEALAMGKVVYVHCLAGIGRTGTVVGTYLVRHGLSGEQALEKIHRLRRNLPGGVIPSPKVEPQRQLVRNWQPGK